MNTDFEFGPISNIFELRNRSSFSFSCFSFSSSLSKLAPSPSRALALSPFYAVKNQRRLCHFCREPRYKVKLFSSTNFVPPGVWFQEPTMASLCGRLMLNAAKRNITYTPVRFCKSKFQSSFARGCATIFFLLHRSLPCLLCAVWQSKIFRLCSPRLRNVRGRRAGLSGRSDHRGDVRNRAVECDSSERFLRNEWFPSRAADKNFSQTKIPLSFSPVLIRNFAVCFCFSSDERPDWARDRSGEARAAGPPSRRHRSLRYACVQARTGHQGEPQHDPVRVRVAPRRMRLWVVLQCCWGILDEWLACFWD